MTVAWNETAPTGKQAFASSGTESTAQEPRPLASVAPNSPGNAEAWFSLASDRARIQHCADLLEDVLHELRQAEAEHTRTTDLFRDKMGGAGHG